MSNQDKIETIGHIVFPYNSAIMAIFFKEVPPRNSDVYLGNKKITTQYVSGKFKTFLIQKGFEVRPSGKKTVLSRSKVCGVEVSVFKNCKGKEVKELMVTIKATSSDELSEKKNTLISSIKKFIPEVKYKQATTDKFVRC